MSFKILYLAALTFWSISGGFCDSWFKNDTQRCSRECAVTGMNKLSYTPSKTYIYSYTGASTVKVNGIQDAKTDMMWSAKLHISLVTPCDAAIEIKDPELMSHQSNAEWKNSLTQYPLVISISEGLVGDVCAHPDDNALSLNIKKGIISAFQNSLPSFSPLYSGRVFTEVDITGECPTLYKVDPEYSKTFVTKYKDHKQCTNPNENSILDSVLLKMNLLNETSSECKQEIQDGLIRSIQCHEKNFFKPQLESNRFVEATQQSRIQFLSEQNMKSFDFTDNFIRTSLMYEETRPVPSNSSIPLARNALKSLCKTVDGAIKEAAASQTAQIVELLKTVPANSVKGFLEEIRQGQICDDAKRFEDLFLDIVAFVHQEGALDVMVEELTSKNASFIRSFIYALSLFEYRHPSRGAVGALAPLMSSEEPPFYIKLLAGNIIHEYCSQNSNCVKEPEIKKIFRVLQKVLETSCPGSEEEDAKRKTAMLGLKIIGNMGALDDELEQSVLDCTKNFDVDLAVRGVALESFRRAPCSKRRNGRLISRILDSFERTEIRIGAYLQYMRCPYIQELKSMLSKLSKDPNKEVLVYIATHIENIQSSTLPNKQGLRDLLSNIVISENFLPNYRNLSRDFDFGYYSNEFEIGGEFEGSLIMDDDSAPPRRADANVTLDIFKNVINAYNYGVRLENIEPLLDIFQDNVRLPSFNTKLLKVAELFTRKNISPPEIVMSLAQLMNPTNESPSNATIYTNKESRIDTYLRFFGIEAAFISWSVNVTNNTMQDIFDEQDKEIGKLIADFKDTVFNTTRALQIGKQVYLPTSNGVPLRLKLTSTSVLGMNFSPKTSSRDPRDQSATFHEKILPSISTEVLLQMVYDVGAQDGIKTKTGIYSSDIVIEVTKHGNDIRFHLDIPGRSELVKAKAETYIMRKFPGQQQEKIYPRSFVDPRLQGNACSAFLETLFPFQVCLKYDVTDLFKSKIFPFGKPSIFQIFLQSKISTVTGIKAETSWKVQSNPKTVKVKLEPSGSFTGTGTEIEFVHGDDHFFIDFFGGMDEEIRRSLKIQLQSLKSKYGLMKELSVFTGQNKALSSNDKVLHMLYGGGNQGRITKFHYEFVSMNDLKKYLDGKIEITGELDGRVSDAYRPLGVSLPKFEVRLGSGQLQAETFLRKVSSAGKSEQYNLLSKVTKNNKDLYRVEGQSGIKGSLADRDFVLASNLIGKFGQKIKYETNLDVVHNNKLLKYSFEVKNLAKNIKSMVLELSHSKESQTTTHYKTNAHAEVKDYTPKYEIKGDLEETGRHQYKLDYTLYEDGISRLNIDGPVTTYVKLDETKQQANLTVAGFEGGVMNLEFLYFINKLDTKLKLEIFRAKEIFTNIKYHAERNPATDRNSFKSSFLMKKCVDMTLSGQGDKKHDSMNLHAILYPKTNLQRIVKGFTSIDKVQKVVNAKLFYNLEERPDDNVHLVTHYEGALKEKIISLKGSFGKEDSDYHFTSDVQWGSPTKTNETKRHFLIDVIKPSKEHFRFESLYKISKVDHEKGDVTTLLEVWTFSKNHFKWDSNVCYVVDFDNYKKVTVHGKVHLVTPWFKEMTIDVETDSDLQDHFYGFLSKVGVSSKDSPTALKSHLSINFYGDPNTNSIVGLPNLEWEESDVHFSLDGILASQRIQSLALAMKKERKGDISFHLGRDQKNIIRCRVSQFNSGKWLVNLEGPSSTTIQAISTISTSVDSFTLYPNNRLFSTYWSPIKLRKSHYPTGGAIVHKDPQTKSNKGLPKLIDVDHSLDFLTSLAIKMTSMTGSIDIHSPSNKTDKIAVSIESLQLSDRSFQIEAIFRSPALKTYPRILVHTTFTDDVKSLSVKFRHDASTPVTAEVSGSLQRQLSDVVFYGNVKTPQNQFEVASTLKTMRSPQCMGGLFNASVYSASFGMYDFATAVCQPAYIAVSAGSRQGNFSYIGKFGYRNVFASLSLEERMRVKTNGNYLINPHSTRPFLKASASLWKSSVVSLESTYNSGQLGYFFNDRLRRGFDLIVVLGGTILQDLIEEVFEKSFNPDVNSIEAKIKDLVDQISSTVSKVFDDLRHDKFFPNFESWKEKIFRELEHAIKKYGEMMDHIKQSIGNYFKGFFRVISNIFDKINGLIEKALNWVVKELNSILKDIASIFSGKMSLKKLWELLSVTRIWHWMEKKWDELIKDFQDEVKIIEKIVEETGSFIKQAFYLVWKEFRFFSIFDDVINWIKHWIHGNSSLPDLLRKFFALQLEQDAGFIRMQVPLRRQVHSIEAALRNIGLPEPKSFLSSNNLLSSRKNGFSTELLLENGNLRILKTNQPLTEASPPYDLSKYVTHLPKNSKVLMIGSKDSMMWIEKKHPRSSVALIQTRNDEHVKLYVVSDIVVAEFHNGSKRIKPGESMEVVKGLMIKNEGSNRVTVTTKSFIARFEQDKVSVQIKDWFMQNVTHGLLAMPLIKQKGSDNILIPIESLDKN